MKWLATTICAVALATIAIVVVLRKVPDGIAVNDSVGTELVPLDIDLPLPMFTTGPHYHGVPNLEKPFGRPRSPFMVPAGTWNVALGRSISSTDNNPLIGEIEMVTDGRKEGTERDYVELGPGLQSVTIDLGDRYYIYAVLLWHNVRRVWVYFDVVVQVADDPDFVRNVRTLFNNDIDHSAGFGIGADMHYAETHEGKLINAGGVRARYVRLYSNGNTANGLNHYVEVEVHGRRAE